MMDFRCVPVVKNLSSNVDDEGLIPGQGTITSHAAGQLNSVTATKEPAVFSHSVMSDSLQPHDCSLPGSLSMGFSRQQYWSGLPCPSPGYLLIPGI